MHAVRVAMWSGPRNISTAMMRAFENRRDTVVLDEPLYAAYLTRTGIEHPAREAVIASQPTDLAAAVGELFAPLQDGRRVHYAKHMAHHVARELDLRWTLSFRNVLLIRDPVEVVASYVRARESCEPDDIGLPQQQWLLEMWDEHELEVPILDAGEFLRAPEAHLRWLCDWLGIPFTERMLSWPAGPRDSDGVWAPHWYARVWASTGFEPPPGAGGDADRPRGRRRRGMPTDLRGAARATGAGLMARPTAPDRPASMAPDGPSDVRVTVTVRRRRRRRRPRLHGVPAVALLAVAVVAAILTVVLNRAPTGSAARCAGVTVSASNRAYATVNGRAGCSPRAGSTGTRGLLAPDEVEMRDRGSAIAGARVPRAAAHNPSTDESRRSSGSVGVEIKKGTP